MKRCNFLLSIISAILIYASLRGFKIGNQSLELVLEIICLAAGLLLLLKATRNHPVILYILRWLAAIILIIMIASLLVIHFKWTIGVLVFLRSKHTKEFFDSVHIIANLVIIQILFSCPDWFEWLKDWEITDKAKLTKNMIQLGYVAIVSAYSYWINHYPIYAPKHELKKDPYEKAGYAAAAYDINALSYSLIIGLLIPFILFIVVTIFLFFVKKYNITNRKERFFFIIPKDSSLRLQLKAHKTDYHIKNMGSIEEYQLQKIQNYFNKK